MAAAKSVDKPKGKRKKGERSSSPGRTTATDGKTRFVLARTKTMDGKIIFRTIKDYQSDKSLLGTNRKLVSPDWIASGPKPVGVERTIDDTEITEPSSKRSRTKNRNATRRTLVNDNKGSLDRKPTFYSEVYHDGGGKNDGKPQGPHTVAHTFNENVIEKIRENNASNEPAGIRNTFSKLLRYPKDVEELVLKLVPDYITDPKKSGIRAAVELYQIEYGRMISKLNRLNSSSDEAEFKTLYNEISSLMNLDPVSTYGWQNASQFRKNSKELAGKGEGPGMNWLKNAEEKYEDAKRIGDNDEMVRQKMQMAKALHNRLFDLPDNLSKDFKDAAKERFYNLLKEYFGNDALFKEITGYLENEKFLAWAEADETMWDSLKGNEIVKAKNALESQKKYEELQKSLGINTKGKIILPSVFTSENKRRDDTLESILGKEDFDKFVEMMKANK